MGVHDEIKLPFLTLSIRSVRKSVTKRRVMLCNAFAPDGHGSNPGSTSSFLPCHKASIIRCDKICFKDLLETIFQILDSVDTVDNEKNL